MNENSFNIIPNLTQLHTYTTSLIIYLFILVYSVPLQGKGKFISAVSPWPTALTPYSLWRPFCIFNTSLVCFRSFNFLIQSLNK